ncbi:Yip1 domain-containing protein [Zychaea mexicana]|uniref:Yip1 domain-containing protein n=1 Tax=Zychaea mexicana TaxID=64656 RepID=UPI0022FF3E3C|nr:Yip1 domain-containing protein [Zychaea mexicana]KAI9490099.1 Yip1 domain-containing protein [Zychaea mexicana]
MLSTSSADNKDDLYNNPFASSSDREPLYVEPDLDLAGQSTTRAAKSNEANPFASNNNTNTTYNHASQQLSGSIGSTSSSSAPPPHHFYHEATYSGQDTLDEPVSTTILRDLKQVAKKLQQVLHPKGDRNVLRDWDLWGPLILCLSLAIILSGSAPGEQAVSIFTGVFVIVWLGAAVVTLNAKLLGGAVSFFQSVCVLGYCLFPLVAAAVVALFVDIIWVRLPLAITTFLWSTYASIGFLSESEVHLRNRRALAVYPLCLFYLIISWLILVS